ncbi:Gfo/Idh/MocA family oxidoreductase [Acidobacteria bacterium AH-259-A15]|nr:Gfo/Idh/MocA family oxidoreductase [Acidobacteria bacterium AH-259-A15]
MKRMTRRKFLDSSTKAASGVTALAVGSSRTWAEPLASGETKTVSPNDKIHVALIGSGGMGKGDLRDFLRIDEVECLAIADVDQGRLAEGIDLVEQRRDKSPDAYQDFRRIIDRKDIDVVIVATPDHWHALPMIYACQAGKDVYVEKPLATSIEEGRLMVEAAHRNERIVQVGTQQRSAQHFQDAVSLVQSGKLGKIRTVRAWAYLDWKGGLGNPADQPPPAGVDYDFWLGPAKKRPFNPARFHFTFRWFWDYSGGLMTDWGAHMVDVVMWAMKEDPIGAMAVGGKYGYPDDIMETPDTQQSIVEFPSFSMIWEHMIGCGVGPWQREHGVEFHGQNGILVVDRDGWELHSETDKIDRRDRIYRIKPLPRQRGSRDFHLRHVQNFIQSVKSRKKPAAEVEIGHKSVIACHLGNIAARLRRYVRWDAGKEKITGDAQAQKLVGREYRAPWKLPSV